MKVRRVSFQHSLYSSLVFITLISSFCLLVGGVSADKTTMTSLITNLWNKIFGGKNESQPLQGVQEGGFPNTLEGFGYHFNDNGELLDKKGGRFQFVVRKDDPEYNQKRYNALGEVVTEYLYKVMENDLKLERVDVPLDAKEGEVRSFIFRTRDAATKEKLMVLIHGSGAVRAGQWSRKLIINENIDEGSQMPYIRGAIDEGYGVIVMNPNLNEATVDGQLVKIRGSESPEQHGVYVWRHLVQPAKAENIAMVAHSYGGVVACSIAEEFLKDFQRRVFSVVFTDSVHDRRRGLWSQPVKDFMKKRAVNFVSSDHPLNAKMEPFDPDECLALSAGTPEHERTSHACIKSAFLYIRSNFGTWVTMGTVTPETFVARLRLRSEL